MSNQFYLTDISEKYLAEKKFLTWQGFLSPFPYFWTQRYVSRDYRAGFNTTLNMPYVWHGDKRLYFPKDKRFPKDINIEIARNIYKNLMLENDNNSPHKYFTDSFKVELGDILFDIGAAEAWVSLDNIELVKHVYIFEADQSWIKALQATFAPYKNKVTIINKFASSTDDSNSLQVDSIFNAINQNIVVKLDVEGAEQEVLAGMGNLLANNSAKIVMAVYHKDNDCETLTRSFRSLGYETQTNNGYMLFPLPEWNKEAQFGIPSLRMGILRCWKKQDYPNVEDVVSSLYEDELQLRNHIIASKQKPIKHCLRRMKIKYLLKWILTFFTVVIAIAALIFKF